MSRKIQALRRSMVEVVIIASILEGLFALLIMESSCGFEKDEPPDIYNNVTVQNDTKYKVLITTPCNYRVEAKVEIPDSYAHYRKDTHQLAAIFGPGNGLKYVRGAFGPWDALTVNIPCGACTHSLKGTIYLLDDRIDLIPWGCGRQRPPLLVKEIYATYLKATEGAVPVADKDKIGWSDKPAAINYQYSYIPQITEMNEICDGNPVLFDLRPSCKVLLDAGVLGIVK